MNTKAGEQIFDENGKLFATLMRNPQPCTPITLDMFQFEGKQPNAGEIIAKPILDWMKSKQVKA